ncbi:CHC2 zinc finger domain-containing protein [Candidatus Magnetominusculus dajiuhuensis]|uniref:CHC2 zinc finger domain-containing protein n=1 Tax=Candidatus Magnetominusculus dajiuhuensis TaxID=3137712 RepID=UPI003B42A617
MPKHKKAQNNHNWVDFKAVKDTITMEMVLDHYGLTAELKQSGKNLVGCCPIHQGVNPRQFSVNLDKNIFNCFGNCNGGGNVIDFASKMENVDTRQAALLLKDWFLSDKTPPPAKEAAKTTTELVRKESNPTEEPQEPINPPLTFELKTLVLDHPFFSQHGLLAETVKHFGLGFCQRGSLKGRIAIPIHDVQGQLVAYCGRAVDDEQAKNEGKYKLPANFHKSSVIYNLQRQKDVDTLIIVESYLSVWRLYQAGFENAVALMGSSLSTYQDELLVNTLGSNGKVILLFDADESGQACTEDCLSRLGRRLFVKAIDLSPYAKKPHRLEPNQLKDLIEGSHKAL